MKENEMHQASSNGNVAANGGSNGDNGMKNSSRKPQ